MKENKKKEKQKERKKEKKKEGKKERKKETIVELQSSSYVDVAKWLSILW